MDHPANATSVSRIKITESVKPNIFTTAGKHYFINGVMRCNNFPHITPMTEEQTEHFFEDYRTMTWDDLHHKWQQHAVKSNEETDRLIHGEEGIRAR
ncbi:hypothetical protein M409DRAFT_21681 [Zasmidium cellare ATCC 36951]|uniref:Uncharacterized protein n=1 Tax=Zasmidium cellare ATCC 36951 TaxID=1080233 RepID=A0A6A6CNM2_ZASCE|nr:uncharacterized protein M409DRAFT_21681 [Zasmidium cellare ATCC 36951]KAF2168243.1 hypothetical protein M409DRAFT_21681 [Zasmidium cellare ATCC 36951]